MLKHRHVMRANVMVERCSALNCVSTQKARLALSGRRHCICLRVMTRELGTERLNQVPLATKYLQNLSIQVEVDDRKILFLFVVDI